VGDSGTGCKDAIELPVNDIVLYVVGLVGRGGKLDGGIIVLLLLLVHVVDPKVL
jgi:tetrahydromethanopterin S-methyltransferase subunit F